jgi:glycine dehydrogenase subunit 1
MPFIPHTPEETRTMLRALGVDSVDALFEEIPDELEATALGGIPRGLSEMEVLRLMGDRAARDEGGICFLGAGCYDHHIPAAVWDLVGRGEFMTAYTPYQAEASQGTLQVVYEYQTMMAELTAMDVSNASVYDGGSGLAEAVLMAIRANRKTRSRKVLCAGSLNPFYRAATDAIVRNQGIELLELPANGAGTIPSDALSPYEDGEIAALVIQQPSFFGTLSAVDELVNAAHARGMFVIAVVNPLSLALLEPPGRWGDDGADIACGDGQPLGIPMASGGPSFGFLCCRMESVRQLPGRLIGRTVDAEGREGFVLTLQAREQHIRRAKATSNICTNQGLLVTAATIHMALLGHAGLRRAAARCHEHTVKLVKALSSIEGVTQRFPGPYFHEAVIDLPLPSEAVVEALAERGIIGGLELGSHFPELGHSLLVCATEKRTDAEIETFAETLGSVLEERAK